LKKSNLDTVEPITTSLVDEKVEEKIVPTVNWLVNSLIVDDEWQFKPYKDAESDSKLKFYWRPVFDIEDSSAQVIWSIWKEFGKDFSVNYFENHDLFSSSKKAFVQNVRVVISFFAIEREVVTPGDITRQDVDALEVYIEQKNASYSYVSELLRICRLFYLNSPFLSNGIQFDPYPEAINPLSKVVKRISKPDGHTDTLYPMVGLSLLNHALRKISDSKSVLQRYEYYLQLKHSGKSNSYKIYREKYSETFREIKRKVDVLYASSILVLLTLSAMRKHEMSHIELSEAEKLLDGRQDLLTGKVFKTARTSTGKKTDRTVVKELKEALSIVVSLTAPMRKKYRSKYLFLRLLHGDGHSIESKSTRIELAEDVLYRMLDVFAEDAGYVAGTLRPHMFRRFFSLMWAWRFETGDMEYLSDLLFHNGQQFTKVYTSDEAVWEFIPEELKILTKGVLEKALLGEKSIYFGFSRAIKKYQNLIKKSVQVVGVSKAEIIAERLVEQLGYIVMPAADGYCFMNLSRASRARCGMNGMPEYSNRSEELCSKCPNFGVPLDRKEHWKRRYEAHKHTFETTKSSELRTAAENGMRRAQRLLNSMEEDV
jgi:hypothetical protein